MDLKFKCVSFSELTVYELYAALSLRQEVFCVEQNCVYLDTDGSVGNIYLCDLNGKIISQIAINNRAKMQFDLTDYPAGTYLLRYEYAPDKWLTSKIIRVR